MTSTPTTRSRCTALVKLYDQMSLLLIDGRRRGRAAGGCVDRSCRGQRRGPTERSPRPTGSAISSVSSGPSLPIRCWLSCCWPRRSAPAAPVRPRWACSPRCWSRKCRARRGWRFAGCARWRWSGSATSTRPNASCWRPSRWIRTGRCRCSIWPASPPIAATWSAALALLRRAGAGPDHPLVELLTRYRAEPRRDLGRNQPCWCGSGRKYKKCHLGREQLPLAERAGWLYAKAVPARAADRMERPAGRGGLRTLPLRPSMIPTRWPRRWTIRW